MNIDASILATLGNLAAQGLRVDVSSTQITILPATVEAAPVAAPVAQEAAPAPVATSSNLLEIRTIRGHVLRSYNLDNLSANDRKIARMMQVCVSEGMHLWEIPHAIYCASNGQCPTIPPDISSVGLYLTYDPIRCGWKASYVRQALIDYVKARENRLIARLKSI